MKLEREWRELYRCADPRIARMVATSIEAMEFDCRLHSTGDPAWLELDEAPKGATFYIEVDGADWSSLREVLDEIITEQLEFDDFLDRWHLTARQREQKALIVMIIIVGALAAVGAIEL